MPGLTETPTRPQKSRLERALSLVTDVRAGEGATAMLMLVNVFLLLICYSVIKTVREPLILLGGGAEVRSYAAAGQALVLIGFVPLYGWFASRVHRGKLLVGVTLFFVCCLELFASAVAARVPYVGVAFFIWVGIFNMSLVAQFWSFANDIYTKESGDRLFPVIMIGMTAGAPLGSFVAARLFRLGFTPQIILQTSAALLCASVLLYVWINRRETARTAAPQEPLSASGGFQLVLSNGYLRLIAALIVLLNIVNTTGEYLMARLLTGHVGVLAAANPGFDKQAYIGAFSGEYQFWVNVTALVLQAIVTSRLVKYRGLRGALLALPLIALGGYSIIAAGVGFSIVRWIKTAENATDYSIMNTARQMLWLKTTREEKYKAKQAIDTFFVRGGDLVSAGVVLLGTGVLHLTVSQFALANTILTVVWLGVALMILKPRLSMPRVDRRQLVTATAMLAAIAIATPAAAQETREQELAAKQAEKATQLHPYVPDTLERRVERLEGVFMSTRAVYPFIGSVYDGGGLAVGPGYRTRIGDTGAFDAHAAWSIRDFKSAAATLALPSMAKGRLQVEMHGSWMDAPSVARYGTAIDPQADVRSTFAYRNTTVGASATMQSVRFVGIGAGVDAIATKTDGTLDPNYRRTRVFAEFDSRTSPNYTRSGALYRIEWSDYHQTNEGASSFQRLDVQANQFVPLMRENWVIALRAEASSTTTGSDDDVPFFLMPDLGGSHALRGYPSWRFRDRNRMLLSGEYRWTAGSFIDMALFLDAGNVAPRFSDLKLDSLKTSYGVGVRFHTFQSTALRVELAQTREGKSVVFGFSPSF